MVKEKNTSFPQTCGGEAFQFSSRDPQSLDTRANPQPQSKTPTATHAHTYESTLGVNTFNAAVKGHHGQAEAHPKIGNWLSIRQSIYSWGWGSTFEAEGSARTGGSFSKVSLQRILVQDVLRASEWSYPLLFASHLVTASVCFCLERPVQCLVTACR